MTVTSSDRFDSDPARCLLVYSYGGENMNQNYNNPVFVCDVTGIPDQSTDEITTAVRNQFLKAYPTAAEAINFALCGGKCIMASFSTSNIYFFDSMRIASLLIAPSNVSIAFALVISEDDTFNINVEYGGGGIGPEPE